MNKIPEYALFGHTDFGKIKFYEIILNIRIWFKLGPTFGCNNCDIRILNNSNVAKCKTDLGAAFNLPDGYEFQSENARNYLSGNYDQWLATEIEVYEIN